MLIYRCRFVQVCWLFWCLELVVRSWFVSSGGRWNSIELVFLVYFVFNMSRLVFFPPVVAAFKRTTASYVSLCCCGSRPPTTCVGKWTAQSVAQQRVNWFSKTASVSSAPPSFVNNLKSEWCHAHWTPTRLRDVTCECSIAVNMLYTLTWPLT